MACEARRRGAGHVRQLVILGDGAAWVWNLAAQHFPEATQIIDLYHAREHLHELARPTGVHARRPQARLAG
jgi:transposase